jgi:hypothetical protein
MAIIFKGLDRAHKRRFVAGQHADSSNIFHQDSGFETLHQPFAVIFAHYDVVLSTEDSDGRSVA